MPWSPPVNMSPRVTTASFIATQRRGFDVQQKSISQPSWLNGQRLCTTVIEPVMDCLGGITITSGYRSYMLNRAVGGSQNPLSAHVLGRAMDFVPSKMGILDAFKAIVDSGIKYDKAIIEGVAGKHWIHLQVNEPWLEPRHVAYMTFGDKTPLGSLVYTVFNPNDPRLGSFA